MMTSTLFCDFTICVVKRSSGKPETGLAWSFKVRTVDELNALCPLGSDEDAYYRMVVSYWEMVASFITSEVLSHEFVLSERKGNALRMGKNRGLVPQVRKTAEGPSVVPKSGKGCQLVYSMDEEQCSRFLFCFFCAGQRDMKSFRKELWFHLTYSPRVCQYHTSSCGVCQRE